MSTNESFVLALRACGTCAGSLAAFVPGAASSVLRSPAAAHAGVDHAAAFAPRRTSVPTRQGVRPQPRAELKMCAHSDDGTLSEDVKAKIAALGLEFSFDDELLAEYLESDSFKKESTLGPLEDVLSNANEDVTRSGAVKPVNAMEFFRAREGEWTSWRVTHHLAFRRSETGDSDITMACLDGSDQRIRDLCVAHDLPPDASVGGCYVTWEAQMSWDQEGENHKGSTVFALVPDEGSDGARGRILRDRGYAEIVQIAGTYELDSDGALNLNTPYDGGEVVEKFVFDGPDIVNRVSTVKRFGGFATATYATERRRGTVAPVLKDNVELTAEDYSAFGWGDAPTAPKPTYGRRSTFGGLSPAAASLAAQGPPSMRSAFSTGFQTGSAASSGSTVNKKAQELAAQGPPSMRPPAASTSADEGTSSADTSE
eukprot:CAMPEP_0185835374 /NCGR_PEP_ID=MMETSP1353-20130828/7634_1 /TAXON_ID=1077150 /ORGANISM="Erythrolobus australicus, Strain CCMP3124" /LENGTH=426 /DNA_ID=CAMNT_0028533985 /DNA_START=29 /DNA_END=1309 /DNA_ORIENTATION=+